MEEGSSKQPGIREAPSPLLSAPAFAPAFGVSGTSDTLAVLVSTEWIDWLLAAPPFHRHLVYMFFLLFWACYHQFICELSYGKNLDWHVFSPWELFLSGKTSFCRCFLLHFLCPYRFIIPFFSFTIIVVILGGSEDKGCGHTDSLELALTVLWPLLPSIRSVLGC